MTRPRKIRLALVFNGGVSLAVWMGGVTHELDLLRRASKSVHGVSQPESEGEHIIDAGERNVFNLWKEILEEKKDEVSIDVISGTSAGGLNGAFLAASIARGIPLPSLCDVWTDEAALRSDKLLTPSSEKKSLLSGDHFARVINNVLAAMDNREEYADPVSLFLTATALGGPPRKFRDGYSGEFAVADHRRIYRFQRGEIKKYAGNGAEPDNLKVNDFADGSNDGSANSWTSRLKTAARASAGFPVAFAPIAGDLLAGHRVLGTSGRWIIDGGVLNNAPFGPVLDEIADRKVEGPILRVLVYVVPSSGLPDKDAADTEPRWPEVLRAAINYPGEANLRTGIAELGSQIAADSQTHQQELFAKLRSTGAEDYDRLLESARYLFGEYRNSRIVEAVWKARQLRYESAGPSNIWRVHKQKPTEIMEENSTRSWVPNDFEALESPEFQPWPWGIRAAERVVWTLVKHLEEVQKDREGLSVTFEALSDCAREVRAMEHKAFEMLRTEHAGPATRAADGKTPTQRINEVYAKLNLPDGLGRSVEKAIAAHVAAEYPDADSTLKKKTLRDCLISEVLTRAFAPHGQLGEYVPEFEYLRLGPDDGSEAVPDSEGVGDRKLYGTRLRHFGAFVSPDWRKSDFAWGRLDGSHHLLRVLFDGDRDRRVHYEKKLHEAILEASITAVKMKENLAILGDTTKNDADLFAAYLSSNSGRDDADSAISAFLSFLNAADSPIPGRWSKLLLLAFQKKVDWGSKFRPFRLITGPGRRRWRRRILKKHSFESAKDSFKILALGTAISLLALMSVSFLVCLLFFSIPTALAIALIWPFAILIVDILCMRR